MNSFFTLLLLADVAGLVGGFGIRAGLFRLALRTTPTTKTCANALLSHVGGIPVVVGTRSEMRAPGRATRVGTGASLNP